MKKAIINILSTILIAVIFVAGSGLLLYPTVSDWWNQLHRSQEIMTYTQTVSGLSDEEYDALYQQAEAFNQKLLSRKNPYVLPEEDTAEYDAILNIGGTGVMGYIKIPAISCSLPIYHGTSERTLQDAIGHLEWTSLPVGGVSTHCVLSGHRGLPSAKLFTDLDRLVAGDIFTLSVLDEVLTYEVDQVLVVLPDETDPLRIQSGEDYCTLVTCTPYGINTHRLLVRGRRIATVAEERAVRVSGDSTQVEPVMLAPFAAAPLALVLAGWRFTGGKKDWDLDWDLDEEA